MARGREMQKDLMKLLLKSKLQGSPLNVGDPRILKCPLKKVEDIEGSWTKRDTQYIAGSGDGCTMLHGSFQAQMILL